jgi:nitrate reductase NapE component
MMEEKEQPKVKREKSSNVKNVGRSTFLILLAGIVPNVGASSEKLLFGDNS